MRTALAFFLGLVLFIAGAEGRLGSILAAFIDPGSLQEGSPQDGCGNTTQPDTVPPTSGNTCPDGYIYDSSAKTCRKLTIVAL